MVPWYGSFDGTTFTLSNQACQLGERVTGIDVNGLVTCELDVDTTYMVPTSPPAIRRVIRRACCGCCC